MSERRSAVFFAGDVRDAAEQAAIAMEEHLPDVALRDELTDRITDAIEDFWREVERKARA